MRHLKMFLALLICVTLLIVLPSLRAGRAESKQKTVKGYITNVTSPTTFEIDYYKVSRDESVKMELVHESPELKFKPEDIRVGAEVEVRGDYNALTDDLKADKIKIDMEQFRKFRMAAVLGREPEGIEQTPEGGWRGVFFPDGHRVRIEPATQVLFKLNKAEEKAEKQKAKEEQKKSKDAEADEAKAEQAEADEDAKDAQPLKTIKDVGVGMMMTYEGTEQPDGTVLAERVIFMRNEMEKGEASLWKSFNLKEKAASFAEGKPGELKIDGVGKYKILPNQEVQTYISNLGQALVPSYQRMMPDTDPQKIPFKFYVVVDKEPNAFALANGVVVINSSMFDILENEAQLAAVVSHEIAHATQEHTWRQMNKDKKKRTALAVGGMAAAAFGFGGVQDITGLVLAAMVNGYQRTLENQADRVGLEYMVDSGFDPREAPQVWKLMAKKFGDRGTNFFYSNHDNHMKRRTFLMIEIRNNYSQLDLNTLKRGTPEDFHKMAMLVQDSSGKKKDKKKS
ncbi:MAG: M48 family metallopeptidase [Rubrivivax sp.]|nr:M48 family metallopeptidase [Pyrinomonadaceae bacterium]